MIETLNPSLVGGGLALGVLFGVVVQRSRFCTLAALSHFLILRDWRQAHAYLAAVAVAVAGTTLLEAGGWVAVAESTYRGAAFNWLGILAGGLVFGFGVALAGGCAGRLLVRSAEGDLTAVLATLAFAFGATAAIYGALVPVRTWLISSTAIPLPGMDGSLASILGISPGLVAAVVIGLSLAVMALTGRGHRSLALLAAGAALGALTVAGWWVTGYFAHDPFADEIVRPASLTFAGPLAHGAQLVISADAAPPVFGIALMLGVLAGALVSALAGRRFHLVQPAPGQIGRALAGGAMMGVGAVFAGGCNIGQGLSGVSTLAAGAFLAVAAIVAGMWLGLAWLTHAEARRAARPESHVASPTPAGTEIHPALG